VSDQGEAIGALADALAERIDDGDEYVTVEQSLERAPLDLKEEDVHDVFGGKVRIRSLTAAQAARVKQASIHLGAGRGGGPEFGWAEAELMQFEMAVIKPKFSADDVRTLHLTSGPSFAKVIAAIDKLSGTNAEKLREAQKGFRGPEQ
jgi:hypothetical protein